MTDEDVSEINRLVKECKQKNSFDICRLEVLPCSRVIDNGKCPVIIEYLQNKEKINDKRTT